MPRCSQCSNAAFYEVGDGKNSQSLCLTCWGKLQDVQFRTFLMHAAGMNHASDEMDSIVGLGFRTGGRFPVEALARAASMARTYNNISISNSTVGVVNTGNLARIDAAITMSQGTETAEFGARLKDLTEAILKAEASSAETRQQLIEVTQAISDQAIGNKKPSSIVIDTLFDRLRSMASDVSTVAGAVERLHQAWEVLKGFL